ncbi:MAG: non-ribosomal peptide synthetase, partial [Acidobacteria bacterium]
GGAYVPLDPRYPKERLRFMLEDSEVRLLLTEQALLGSLPEVGAPVLCLDAERQEIGGEPGVNLARLSEPENLAYVIYTSGSTGRPKGVAIVHRNAVALVSWARRRYTIEELSGVLFSTSVCFDLSVFELFAPLGAGGAVVVAQDALALCGLGCAERVRLINTVPSAASELLRLGCLPRSAKTLNLAGEPLATSLVRRLYEEGGVEQVFDLYGPTEDTTYSTCGRREGVGAATVGRPLANRRAYVLDAGMRPVPVGVEGEVYLGGAGVTRGYLNRPGQTAERYVPDLYGGERGARLYRTGDVARYLADGRLEYAGRRDQQVKVRGFRIELGEIEGVLGEHESVEQAVVSVQGRETEAGPRLVGYYVGEADAEELRRWAREKLPEHMVPWALMRMEQIPLLPNGKIDRRALPEASAEDAATRAVQAAPRTLVEEMVAGVWGEVLGLEAVGVNDNFFELGRRPLAVGRVGDYARAAGVPT